MVRVGVRKEEESRYRLSKQASNQEEEEEEASHFLTAKMLTVSVKWQKKVFEGIEIDPTLPPYVFKAQLYDLTGVPPERQKIMVKGGLLKDDADWSAIGVKDGQKLMMMGTADEIVKAPEKAIVFAEDLPEEEQATHLGYSAGLVNLGNTCYMNSTVQCLKSVPELKSALSNYALTGRSNDVDQTSHMLTVATRELFGDLDRSVNAVSPTQFWMTLRKKFPQFSQLQNGMHMQQDAEECWTQLLYTLSQSLKAPTSSEDSDAVKALFGVNLRSRVHCQESGEESSETESVYSLKCHISHEVNHLHEGLKHGLKGELEKTSPALGRTALYLKESLIDSLPRYLTVQFVRFFWKRETNQKAKILRKVDYPLELDIFDLCSEELRKKLEAPRQKLRDEEGKKLGLQPKSSSKDSDVKMTDAEASSKESGESSTVTQQEGGSSEKGTLHMTGIYDLVSVLTHKGRSADSGHYVAWVKQESGKWIQYDDSHPSLQREEDITKLSGGGDWHMAYIIMYKARFVSIEQRSFTITKTAEMPYPTILTSLLLLLHFTFVACTIPLGSVLYATGSNQSSWSSPSSTFSVSFVPSSPPGSFLAAVSFAGNVTVWSAGSVDSRGSLRLLPSGSLRLISGSNTTLWDSGTDGVGVVSGTIDDSGELRLLNNLSITVWSSFDHPTDTVVQSQNFTAGMVLRSGNYSFQLERRGNLTLKWNNSTTYWSQGLNSSLNMSLSSLSLHTNGLLLIFDSTHNGGAEIVYSVDYGEGSSNFMFLKLDDDGNLRIYSSASRDNGPMTSRWSAVADQCLVYGYCGNFGICTHKDTNPICLCPSLNFDHVDENDKRKGCKRKTQLTLTRRLVVRLVDRIVSLAALVLLLSHCLMGVSAASVVMIIIIVAVIVRAKKARKSDWNSENIEEIDFEREQIMKIFGDHISEEEEKIARKMVLVGLWCIQTNPTRRPAMIKVIEMLEGSLEALEVPPKHLLCLTATRVPETTEDSNNETSSFSYPSQFERGTLSGDDTLRISA
ncbi:hypothetical protein HID58_020767 [Brassica napus]|uniref:ubiquitinyl hydrolase 1 n=1 Tax=Brassica napus TaxID=3708 RepID=A0ABQ8CUN0_BRANA|nr:hypothetical protein HID58_020767 [Brassica napus]